MFVEGCCGWTSACFILFRTLMLIGRAVLIFIRLIIWRRSLILVILRALLALHFVELKGVMDGAATNWIPSCMGVGIVLGALAFRGRIWLTMVTLAADVDLKGEPLSPPALSVRSIINMIVRRCESLMTIDKVVVAAVAVEVDFIVAVMY